MHIAQKETESIDVCALELAMHYMLFNCAGVYLHKVNNSMYVCMCVSMWKKRFSFFFVLPMEIGYSAVSIPSFSFTISVFSIFSLSFFSSGVCVCGVCESICVFVIHQIVLLSSLSSSSFSSSHASQMENCKMQFSQVRRFPLKTRTHTYVHIQT